MKLSDTQAVMLSKASQHPQGLVPPPACPPAPRAQIERKLLGADLMEEVVGSADPTFAWHTTADGPAGFYRITAAGLRAIGVEPDGEVVEYIEGAFDPLTGTAGAAPAEDSGATDPDPSFDPEATAIAQGIPVPPDAPDDALEAAMEAQRDARAAEAAPHPIVQDFKKALAEAKPTRAARAKEKAEARTGIVRTSKRAEAEAAADRGELPEPPDFTAATHAPYRKRLAKLVELAQAGDTAALRAEAINPTSTSPRALIRYRDLAVRAIEARAKGAA